MWYSLVHVKSGLDTLFLPQKTLINQTLVPQRIGSTNLEVMRWEIAVSGGPNERTEQRVTQIFFVRSIVLSLCRCWDTSVGAFEGEGIGVRTKSSMALWLRIAAFGS